MSVKLRGIRWHYRFMYGGKDYSGPCVGCETKTQAAAFEAAKRRAVENEAEELKQTEADIRKNRTVTALVENYRFELAGGHPIAIADACRLASEKPSHRAVTAHRMAQRERYWGDFAAWLAANYPDVTTISAIRKAHCEAYVFYLMENGRFIKDIAYTRQYGRKRRKETDIAYTRKVVGICGKTIHEIAMTCRWVISRLEEDAGIVRNPWNGVTTPTSGTIDREVFTCDELALIWEGLKNEDFLRPLFVIAANSGLTEGDICTLKWSDVDFTASIIRRRRRKTGVEIVLPLLPELAAYLKTLPCTADYILPEHAQRYLTTSKRGVISHRIKRFLEDLGIRTCVERPGFKNVSIKDLHSLRHIFCYRARKAGIPETIIQRMVGHAVLEMTRHYADHDTEEDMLREIKKLPALFVGEQGDNQGEVEDIRQRFAALLPSVPVETIRRWLDELEHTLSIC